MESERILEEFPCQARGRFPVIERSRPRISPDVVPALRGDPLPRPFFKTEAVHICNPPQSVTPLPPFVYTPLNVVRKIFPNFSTFLRRVDTTEILLSSEDETTLSLLTDFECP